MNPVTIDVDAFLANISQKIKDWDVRKDFICCVTDAINESEINSVKPIKTKIMDNLTPKSVVDRLTSDTPTFFKKLRTLMIAIGAVGGAIAMAPVALPAIVVTLSGYLITVGAVGAALSQLTVSDK